MKDREKILRYFAATGDEAKDMAMRLLDLADAVDRGRPLPSGLLCRPLRHRLARPLLPI